MEPAAILRQAAEGNIKLIRFLYCGSDGVIRGKSAHADYLDARLAGGIGLTVAMQSFSLLDQLVAGGSYGPVGEVRLMPDPETFSLLPHHPKTARLYCDLEEREGGPWGACPRAFLRRMAARAG